MCAAVLGQIEPSNEWVRIESPAKDFSFAIPASGYLVDNEDGGYRVYYSGGTIYLSATMEKQNDAKEIFRRSLGFMKDVDRHDVYQSGDFLIRQFSRPKNDGGSYLWMDMASSKGRYVFSVTADAAAGDTVSQILGSVRLGGAPVFKSSAAIPAESSTINISSLKTDKVVLVALNQPDSDQSKFENGSVASNGDVMLRTAPSGTPVAKIKYSRPLIILRKPRAQYTESGRSRGVNGTVKLRVKFQADGRVGPVDLLASVDKGLARNALSAARKIKFLPAEVDGKPVEVSRIIEYGFSVY